MSDAEKIYKAIFKGSIPPSIEEKFQKAFEALAAGFPEVRVEEYKTAVEGIHDIEALELAGRYRKKLPLLVHAFEIMVYITETVPGNQSEFINFKTRTIFGFLLMAYGGCRSTVKFLKGLFLLRKIKNV
jgi:hypothetical protein